MIPSKVRVMGLDYEVHNIPGLSSQENSKGTITYNTLTVKIDDALSEKIKLHVLLHEIIHAIDWDMKLDLDENTTARLASGLFQALSDNPEFVKQFVGSDAVVVSKKNKSKLEGEDASRNPATSD